MRTSRLRRLAARGVLAPGIATKLLAINLFIFLVFGLVVGLVSLSFRNIEELLTTTIVRDVDENVVNAGILKDLSTIFADTNLLASTFFRKEALLEIKGRRLVETTDALAMKSTYRPLQSSLRDFSRQLQLLFEQCARVNQLLRQAETIEHDLHAHLTDLERVVSAKKVSLVLAGEDPTLMEQLSVLISGYRETFLQVNILFLASATEGLPPGTQREATPLVSLIDELSLRFRTLTASEPRIAAYGPKLLAALASYRRTVLRHLEAMDELNRRLSAIEGQKSRLISATTEVEQKIATSAMTLRRDISSVMRRTAVTITLVSVAVLLVLGGVTFFFIISNIRRPMAVIQAGIESIRAGRLDTRIDLKRHDEWSVIETALNRMASDLKSSSEARHRLEDQLRQSQKMEAIGTLAGGVAHDFNNIVTAVVGYASLLKMDMPPGDPMVATVDEILSSAERAAALTRNLLAFSRKQIMTLKPFSLNEAVKRIESLLGRLIGEDIDLKTRLAAEDPTILADRSQIEQVLMNLATNARDAMPEGGTLAIETGRVELHGRTPGSSDEIAPGSYAVISVSDTGQGMDAATQQRIFEPFFTTKRVGSGTGLGLSIVYGIVKQHGGEVTVRSEPGKGTTFIIYLPLAQARAESERLPALTPAPVGGSETVLVAEDDAPVRRLITRTLRDFGYAVIEAVDGEDAVRKFAENQDAVDLLILDVVMPRKNGKEAYEAISKLKSEVRVIYASGYTADIISQKGILEEGLDFLHKPVTPQALLAKVRAVLGSERPPRNGRFIRPS